MGRNKLKLHTQAALLLLPLLMLCGCAKPEYWIRGLSLPPGATEVSVAESKHRAPAGAAAPRGGRQYHVLTIKFDCPGGWAIVLSHVDRCLRQAGYVTQLEWVQANPGTGAGTAAQSAPGQDAGQPQGVSSTEATGLHVEQPLASYRKASGGYSVTVENLAATLAYFEHNYPQMAEGMARGLGKGQYQIIIMDTTTSGF